MASPDEADTSKAARVWSEMAERRSVPGREGWFYAVDHPRILAAQRERLGGVDPIDWGRPRVPRTIHRALEVGCGAGDLALRMAADGWFEACDAFDVAEAAIATAQARAAAAGYAELNFFVADGNTLELPPDTYDLIYANHALHHIENLEHLFEQAASALKPDGVLFASDYVGPSRMQYSDGHIALMNDMLARIEPEKRLDRCHGNREKLMIGRTPLQAFLDVDPSEAPRSAEIIPTLRRYFDVEVLPLGTRLTYEVLLGIVHHFDPDDPADNAMVDRLIELDRIAEESGQADMLFANLVCRPRTRGAGSGTSADGGLQAAGPAAFAAAVADHPDPRGHGRPWEDIAGWLQAEAADLTVDLCRLQAGWDIQTGVLELGVYQGKYLALLAVLHEGTGLTLVGVDMFIERIGESIAAEHHAYFVEKIVDAVMEAAPRSMRPDMIVARTQDVGAGMLLGRCPAGFSFVSVDAGHEVDDVMNDLALAAAVLSPTGIVALDDAYNRMLPGVTEGLVRYLARDGARLAGFALCGNKLFLCRPDMHATYLAYVRWLVAGAAGTGHRVRTREHDLNNQGVLFVPRLAGLELMTFLDEG